ncbi:Lrp/AsnC family transcriptional regulator [Actinoplanes sp. CA-142083]|uniref:Lrp/AsnC family transcriptional regulator n=1 Tax=Actinoplanes sp. CA-142083 TaxID=3239903 RepID=UPI003D8B5F31
MDDLDRKLLQALQLDGRAPFSRLASVLGVSDQTVARRFRRLETEVGLRVLGMPDESRLGRSNWQVRLLCTPGEAGAIADALAARPDMTYVALLSGGAEVVGVLKPRSTRDRDELLLGQLRDFPGVVGVTAYNLLHRFFGGRLGWLRKIDALTPAEEVALRPPIPAEPGNRVTLDAADEALLAALAEDGRAPLAALQKASGQSEEVVRRRLERLQGGGVLYFDVQYSPELMGLHAGAMLWMSVAPPALSVVGAALAGHREIEFVAATTGPANIVAAVRCRDDEELFVYLNDKIGALEQVHRIETGFMLRQIKRLTRPAR